MSIKSFSDYIVESSREATFTFGRYNPPTIGHQKLIDKVITIAKRVKGLPVLYVSATQDKKKNPLSAKDKLKYIKMHCLLVKKQRTD